MILCDYESSNGWFDHFDRYRWQSILFAPGKCKTCLLLKSCLIEFLLDISGILIFLSKFQPLLQLLLLLLYKDIIRSLYVIVYCLVVGQVPKVKEVLSELFVLEVGYLWLDFSPGDE